MPGALKLSSLVLVFSVSVFATSFASAPHVVATSLSDNVTGADMAGLIVTETYDAPFMPSTLTSLTSVWERSGPTSGSATALTLGGETITSISIDGSASDSLAWQYSSGLLSSLNSIELDGTAAGIYFDRAHSTPSTPGSGPGADVTFSPSLFNAGSLDGIVVTYSDPVSLQGHPPRGDLYAKLLIDFSALQPFQGLEPQDFAFTQPTDRDVTPEPTSSQLIWVGLAAFVCLRRRMRQSLHEHRGESLLGRS